MMTGKNEHIEHKIAKMDFAPNMIKTQWDNTEDKIQRQEVSRRRKRPISRRRERHLISLARWAVKNFLFRWNNPLEMFFISSLRRRLDGWWNYRMKATAALFNSTYVWIRWDKEGSEKRVNCHFFFVLLDFCFHSRFIVGGILALCVIRSVSTLKFDCRNVSFYRVSLLVFLASSLLVQVTFVSTERHIHTNCFSTTFVSSFYTLSTSRVIEFILVFPIDIFFMSRSGVRTDDVFRTFNESSVCCWIRCMNSLKWQFRLTLLI